MRGTLITLGAEAAVLAAGSIPPASAPAAVITPRPASGAAEQLGRQNYAYPAYAEIADTTTAPTVTYINGTPGISSDIYNIGGTIGRVSAGVAVHNCDGHARYFPYGQRAAAAGRSPPRSQRCPVKAVRVHGLRRQLHRSTSSATASTDGSRLPQLSQRPVL